MLINPELYIDNLKNKSIENLIKERDKIIRQIQHYENNKDNIDKFDIYPTPEDVYEWNNVVLIKLTSMIMDKCTH